MARGKKRSGSPILPPLSKKPCLEEGTDGEDGGDSDVDVTSLFPSSPPPPKNKEKNGSIPLRLSLSPTPTKRANERTSSPTRAEEPEELPPVFIPTKGRHWREGGTAIELARCGVPFTLVVEPQELQKYTDRWNGVPECRIVSLDADNKGVTYARNFIIDNLMPETGHFWVMDDDVRNFQELVGQPGSLKCEVVPARRLFEVVRPESLRENVVTAGISYNHHMTRLAKENKKGEESCMDTFTFVVTFHNATLIRQLGLRYRFRVREDTDWILQVITRGYRTQRFLWFALRHPESLSVPGGMTPYYNSQFQGDAKWQNSQFMAYWGCLTHIIERGSAEKGTDREETSVNWKSLHEKIPLWRKQVEGGEAGPKALERVRAEGPPEGLISPTATLA